MKLFTFLFVWLLALTSFGAYVPSTNTATLNGGNMFANTNTFRTNVTVWGKVGVNTNTGSALLTVNGTATIADLLWARDAQVGGNVSVVSNLTGTVGSTSMHFSRAGEINVGTRVTGGTGTTNDPFTGWEFDGPTNNMDVQYFFPSGVYSTTGLVFNASLSPYSRIRVRGEYGTVLRGTGAARPAGVSNWVDSSAVIYFYNTNTSSFNFQDHQGYSVENMVIDGASNAMCGVEFFMVRGVNMDNVEIINTKSSTVGLHSVWHGSFKNVWSGNDINNVQFQRPTNGIVIGCVNQQGWCTDLNFIGCVVSGLTNGVWINGGTQINFLGCQFELCSGAGVVLTNCGAQCAWGTKHNAGNVNLMNTELSGNTTPLVVDTRSANAFNFVLNPNFGGTPRIGTNSDSFAVMQANFWKATTQMGIEAGTNNEISFARADIPFGTSAVPDYGKHISFIRDPWGRGSIINIPTNDLCGLYSYQLGQSMGLIWPSDAGHFAEVFWTEIPATVGDVLYTSKTAKKFIWGTTTNDLFTGTPGFSLSMLVGTNFVVNVPAHFSNSMTLASNLTIGGTFTVGAIETQTLVATNALFPYQSIGSNAVLHVSANNAAMTTILTNNTTLYPTNLMAGTNITSLLWITQDGTGNRTAIFGTNTLGQKWKWSGGTAPTLTTNAGAQDLITITVDPSGTNFVGIATLNVQ